MCVVLPPAVAAPVPSDAPRPTWACYCGGATHGTMTAPVRPGGAWWWRTMVASVLAVWRVVEAKANRIRWGLAGSKRCTVGLELSRRLSVGSSRIRRARCDPWPCTDGGGAPPLMAPGSAQACCGGSATHGTPPPNRQPGGTWWWRAVEAGTLAVGASDGGWRAIGRCWRRVVGDERWGRMRDERWGI